MPIPGCRTPAPFLEVSHAGWFQGDDGPTDVGKGCEGPASSWFGGPHPFTALGSALADLDVRHSRGVVVVVGMDPTAAPHEYLKEKMRTRNETPKPIAAISG